MSAAPGQLLAWDSEFFGCRVARAADGRLTPASLAELLDWCRREAVDWLYFLADADDDQTVTLAEGAGFHQVDVRIELELALRDRPASASAGPSGVRPARESDLARLRPIAAAGHTDGRYFFDARVPAGRARALYETWIERSVTHGFADVVLVYDVDGTACGYITGRLASDRTASIGLIGVGPEARGRGVGTELVNALLAWASQRGAERATVVTQGRNATAQRLYQRCGFRTRTLQLWYHHWLTTAAVPELSAR